MLNWYNRRLFIGVIASLLIFVNCKHDPFEPTVIPIPIDTIQTDTSDAFERCLDFDSLLGECQIGPFYNDMSPAYMYPTINPNNPNEFAYYVDKKVYKYDIVSKTSTLLADNIRVIDRMDWGAKSWITFSTLQWKVWVLKDDGSVLQQISFTPRDLGPEFSFLGNHVIYVQNMDYTVSEIESNPELAYRSKMIIADINGEKVDSICLDMGKQCAGWDVSSWNSMDQIARVDGQLNASDELTTYGISFFDYNRGSNSDLIFNDINIGFIEDIEWLPDNENILFITRYGNNHGTIYKVNINTEELTMIKEGCENRFYNDLSISPDGSFMLAQKGLAVVDGCDVNIKWRIVKMDIDGCNEEVIELE